MLKFSFIRNLEETFTYDGQNRLTEVWLGPHAMDAATTAEGVFPATPQAVTYTGFDRGFTGHEHYDYVHVINANARLYDPTIGRFFSPDPFVQTPDFTQSFNRYSYCLNNPVMYSDPDGEFVGTVLGLISDLFTNLFVKPFTGEEDDWDHWEED